ncbi:MAG: PIN domain-containing protein [Planctomycetes bacterium]|nr:PIN domain-containing protein [Planctomycetota bacterium]
MRALFDSDVLLDLGLDRMPWADASEAALALASSGTIEGFVAWHSLSNVNYIVKGEESLDPREFIARILGYLQVVPVGHSDMRLALRLAISDLEDAMQVAAAIACGADRIVTRNTRHFKGSIVPAVTPAELLKELRAKGEIP